MNRQIWPTQSSKIYQNEGFGQVSLISLGKGQKQTLNDRLFKIRIVDEFPLSNSICKLKVTREETSMDSMKKK